ncbi:cell wall surface anchor family protein [Planoprotostelium fungivorum]|uniref:Cell wall surface anchor family protein n=1 Tax=Planoprotostelium fungivorum TaxID=1890364 RepID=A0A2P6NBY9_9EUKA|nr:cell wall surface anchor family protein [Planoprotostelium fungivorum]
MEQQSNTLYANRGGMPGRDFEFADAFMDFGNGGTPQNQFTMIDQSPYGGMPNRFMPGRQSNNNSFLVVNNEDIVLDDNRFKRQYNMAANGGYSESLDFSSKITPSQFTALPSFTDDATDFSSGSPYSPSSDSSYGGSNLPTATDAKDVKIEVILLHKPRGSQGVWQPIPPGAGLRVTRGKGKRLKVQIKTNIQFNKDAVDIVLHDLMTTVSTKEGFEVQQTSDIDSPYMTELELKLSKYFKRCQFIVTIQTSLGPQKGRTIEFCSHNNGKQSKSDATGPPGMFPQPPEDDIGTSGGISDVVEGGHYSEKRRRNEISGEEERISVIHGNLEVHGTVRGQAFMQFSDQRLKTDIKELADALDTVMKLEGKSYQWKEGCFEQEVGPGRVIGLIAQEVQRVLPEVVHTDPVTGILSVSYSEIIPVIIEGFKQHRLSSMHDQQEFRTQLQYLQSKLEAVERESLVQKSRMYQRLHAVMEPETRIFTKKIHWGVRISLILLGIISFGCSFWLKQRRGYMRKPPMVSSNFLMVLGIVLIFSSVISIIVEVVVKRKRKGMAKEEKGLVAESV